MVRASAFLALVFYTPLPPLNPNTYRRSTKRPVAQRSSSHAMLTSRTCNATDLAVDVDRSVSSLWSSSSSWDVHRAGWAITAGCAILTVLISLVSITSHAVRYQNRNQQRQVIRILLMPAIYAVVAVWTYAADESQGEYLAVIEAVYEAITLSAFMLLLTSAVAESTTGEIGRIWSGFWGAPAREGDARQDKTGGTMVDQEPWPVKAFTSSPHDTDSLGKLDDDGRGVSSHGSYSDGSKPRDGTRARTKRMNAQLAEVMRGKEKRRMPFPVSFLISVPEREERWASLRSVRRLFESRATIRASRGKAGRRGRPGSRSSLASCQIRSDSRE